MWFHVTMLELWNERIEAVRDGAAEVLKVADEHQYGVWRALAHVLGGLATAYLGDPAAGTERVERGISMYEDLQTPPVFWPLVLGLRSRAHQLAGRTNEAYEHVTNAVETARGPRATTTSLFIQKADLEIVMALDDRAEITLWTAYDGAQEAGALTQQLLAAARLVRLGASGARDPLPLLRDSYDRFTEGFERRHLKEAAELLAEHERGRGGYSNLINSIDNV
jgi:hypothetical protein